MTCPQAPEIIAVGNGCAFRWNTEKVIFAILKREKLLCNRRTFCIAVFCFSRLPDVSHKFCNISLWATAICGSALFLRRRLKNRIYLKHFWPPGCLSYIITVKKRTGAGMMGTTPSRAPLKGKGFIVVVISIVIIFFG